jgi:hypothetical protein
VIQSERKNNKMKKERKQNPPQVMPGLRLQADCSFVHFSLSVSSPYQPQVSDSQDHGEGIVLNGAQY